MTTADAQGVPLFVLELGLGQLTRRGTLGMWTKIGLPRWQGVGAVRHEVTSHGAVRGPEMMVNIHYLWLIYSYHLAIYGEYMVNDG